MRFCSGVVFVDGRCVLGRQHSYCSVLRSVHACCLTHSAKQDGLRNLSFLFRVGRDRHSYVLECCTVIGLRWFTSELYVTLWRSRQETESAARREYFFCAITLTPPCFPRGVRWGCAPQTCTKEPLALWTLFFGFAAKYIFPKHCNNRYP